MRDIRRRGLALGALVVAVPLWSACSSGSGGGNTEAQGFVIAKPPAAVCTQLLAVFSDGPDPGADPVGYALSQILPLGEIHSTASSAQPTLAIVRTLIGADKALVRSKGSDHSATVTIKKADAHLNVVCPGVAS
jgi:hypothetical protein